MEGLLWYMCKDIWDPSSGGGKRRNGAGALQDAGVGTCASVVRAQDRYGGRHIQSHILAPPVLEEA